MTEIRLGSVTGSHGIQGWIKVYSYTDPIEAIFSYTPWILRRGDIERNIEIRKGQVHGKKLIAHVEGIDTRDLADELKGFDIYVDREIEEHTSELQSRSDLVCLLLLEI